MLSISKNELGVWDKLFKMIVWEQIGPVEGKKILDFGSGEGITANHYASTNEVVAVEPSEEMLKTRWMDHEYAQIVGDFLSLMELEANSFDMIICHNVLEYIDNKAEVIRALTRVLKPGGICSIVKHNRAGRIMQMAVLLNQFDAANELLDGKHGMTSKFGAIRYYEDEELISWVPELHFKKTLGIRTFWDLQQNQEIQKEEE